MLTSGTIANSRYVLNLAASGTVDGRYGEGRDLHNRLRAVKVQRPISFKFGDCEFAAHLRTQFLNCPYSLVWAFFKVTAVALGSIHVQIYLAEADSQCSPVRMEESLKCSERVAATLAVQHRDNSVVSKR